MSEQKPAETASTAAPANLPVPRLEKATVEKVVLDSIKDILTPAQQKQVAQRVTPKVQALAVSVSTFHSGPLPSAETARGYEQIAPGSFQRVLNMAEKDQDAVIESTRYVTSSDSWYRMACLLGGVLALTLILSAVVFLARYGHESVAMTVAGLGAAGVIGAFVNARWKKD